jgi:hypothetical protein
MAIDNKFERVEANDPNRCQATNAHGQCPYKSGEHSSYCSMHGDNKAAEAHRKKLLNMYHLSKWQNRVDEFSEHDNVKSLRSEIGIARMVMETILNQCNDKSDLLLYSGRIMEMLTKIQGLIVSCHKLESNLGQLLDKASALNLASQIVTIVAEEINDPQVTDRISSRIAVTIGDSDAT